MPSLKSTLGLLALVSLHSVSAAPATRDTANNPFLNPNVFKWDEWVKEAKESGKKPQDWKPSWSPPQPPSTWPGWGGAKDKQPAAQPSPSPSSGKINSGSKAVSNTASNPSESHEASNNGKDKNKIPLLFPIINDKRDLEKRYWEWPICESDGSYGDQAVWAIQQCRELIRKSAEEMPWKDVVHNAPGKALCFWPEDNNRPVIMSKGTDLSTAKFSEIVDAIDFIMGRCQMPTSPRKMGHVRNPDNGYEIHVGQF